jgi:hypothetical protein
MGGEVAADRSKIHIEHNRIINGKSLVSRLNIKTFFEKFDNHLFAAVFVA